MRCVMQEAAALFLDALCKDRRNRYFSLEVQKSDNDDHQKRVRYIGSNIDTFLTEKGTTFKELPDLTVYFLSRFDIFKKGETFYHVQRTIEDAGEPVFNGFHEYYVNTAVRDGSKISELMQYLLHTEGTHPLFPRLSARVQYFKNTKEGVQEMCEIVEAYAQNYAQEYAQKYAQEYAAKVLEEAAPNVAKQAELESALKAVREGVSYEIALRIYPLLSVEELNMIYGRTETV